MLVPSQSLRQPWIHSSSVDLLLIAGPAMITSVAVILFCSAGGDSIGAVSMRADLPLGMWLLFVLGIDVAHVYSTLYRTYFDPEERERYSRHLILIPLLCWVAGVLLYTVGPLFFWSLLAYTAIFHFIRQQYGFYALYARWESDRAQFSRAIDITTVYLAAIYPLLYWHEHLPRAFVWFIDGDFPFRAPKGTSAPFGILLLGLLGLQFAKECAFFIRTHRLNVPKNLVIWGTAAAWYTGIVYLDGDIPFTITNVVSHGVPYITLIWVFGNRKVQHHSKELGRILTTLLTPRGIVPFIAVLIVLAFFEETLWDTLVWRERSQAFGWAWGLPSVTDTRVLSVIVPLLAVPQATHYVLDAFIWRIRKPSSEVSHLLLGGNHPDKAI